MTSSCSALPHRTCYCFSLSFIMYSFLQLFNTDPFSSMQDHMTIRTDRDKVIYRIYDIFLSDLAHRNDMMNVDLICIFGSIFLTKVKITHLACNMAI